jgi:membrane associated rhomboid family serine protease
MHQASVGFHCPECTRQGAQRVYTARTLSRAPVVTQLLIAANVAVFIAGMGAGSTLTSISPEWQIDAALVGEPPPQLTLAFGVEGVAGGEWYRLVTGGFMHAGLIHLAFNMLALWSLGALLEPALGRLRFGLLFGASLLAGSFGVMLVDPGTFTVGASGAVFGLMGAAVAGYRARGINIFQTGLGGVLLINLLLTFSWRGISVGGHIGGLVGGLVCGWILFTLPPSVPDAPWVPTALVAAIGAGCAVGSIMVV